MTETFIPAQDLAAKRHDRFPGETAAYASARRALLAQEIELRRASAALPNSGGRFRQAP
jgi:predicted dithiol-disulfide oxidoreductase (DUF899 family)